MRPALVIVASLLLAACGTPAGQATPEDKHTATSKPIKPEKQASSDGVTIDLEALDAGPEPNIAFSDAAGRWHVLDKVFDWPDVATVAVTGKRFVTKTDDSDAGSKIQVRSFDGNVTATYPRGDLIINEDRSIVAWSDDDNRIWVLEDTAGKPVEFPSLDSWVGTQVEGMGVRMGAITGDSCDRLPSGSAGCFIYFRENTPAETDSHYTYNVQGAAKLLQKNYAVSDATEDGQMVGTVETPDGRCTDYSGPNQASYTDCDFDAFAFSPDGKLLLAKPTDGSGTSDRLQVRNAADGKAILTVTLNTQPVGFWGTAWEDDTHILTVAKDRKSSKTAIVRIGIDGSIEAATKVVKDLGWPPAYALSVRP